VPAAAVEPEPDPIEDVGDVSQLDDAPADDRSTVDRLAEAFPGAELFQEETP
jgi:hypothetical protein